MDFTYMTESEKTEWETSSSLNVTATSGSFFTTGSAVFCTDSSKLYIYNGTAWKSGSFG
jgi:hypothetical protein|tara:strand:+ start:92 stop:268 length:177 start_codon:yes stop_codon:yes gene_type:complete